MHFTCYQLVTKKLIPWGQHYNFENVSKILILSSKQTLFCFRAQARRRPTTTGWRGSSWIWYTRSCSRLSSRRRRRRSSRATLLVATATAAAAAHRLAASPVRPPPPRQRHPQPLPPPQPPQRQKLGQCRYRMTRTIKCCSTYLKMSFSYLSLQINTTVSMRTVSIIF